MGGVVNGVERGGGCGVCIDWAQRVRYDWYD